MNNYPILPDSEASIINFSNDIENEIQNDIENDIENDKENIHPDLSYFGTLIIKINSKISLYKQKFSKIYEIVDIKNSGVEYKGMNNAHINKMLFYYKLNPNAYIAPLNIIQYDEKFYIGSDINKFESLIKLLPIDREVLYYLHQVNSINELENYTIMLNDNTRITYVFPHEKINHFINRLKASYPTLFSMYSNKLKINEIILREKLTEIKLFEKIKLTEIEIFNQLLNFNKKIDIEFKSRIARSRPEIELYTKIFELHKFYCLLYTEYSWVNHFFNYLENEVKFNKFL
jgi:hypothetical protein